MTTLLRICTALVLATLLWPAASQAQETPCTEVTTSHARYRICYDVARDHLFMLKKKGKCYCGKNGEGKGKTKEKCWKVLDGMGPALRPGVNKFIEVRMIGFNDLAGEPKVEYSFEDLHQEYRDVFATAFMSVVPTETSKVGAASETKEDAAEQWDENLKQRMSNIRTESSCSFMSIIDELQQQVESQYMQVEGNIDDVEKSVYDKVGAIKMKIIDAAKIRANDDWAPLITCEQLPVARS